MDFTFTFIEVFFYVVTLAFPLLASMALMVSTLGLIVARLEGWTPFVGFYWAFITATTVGYGDIRAQRKLSRTISVLIAFIGIVFTGITVAIAVESASLAYEVDPELPVIRQRLEDIKNQ